MFQSCTFDEASNFLTIHRFTTLNCASFIYAELRCHVLTKHRYCLNVVQKRVTLIKCTLLNCCGYWVKQFCVNLYSCVIQLYKLHIVYWCLVVKKLDYTMLYVNEWFIQFINVRSVDNALHTLSTVW